MGQERLSKEVGSADVLVQHDSVTTALPHSEARTLGSYSALSVGHWPGALTGRLRISASSSASGHVPLATLPSVSALSLLPSSHHQQVQIPPSHGYNSS